MFILMKSFGVRPPLEHHCRLYSFISQQNGRRSDMPDMALTHFQKKTPLMQLHLGNTKGVLNTKHSWEKVHSPFQKPLSTDKIHKGKTDILFCCDKIILHLYKLVLPDSLMVCLCILSLAVTIRTVMQNRH